MHPVRNPGSIAITICLEIGGCKRRLRRLRANTSTAWRSADLGQVATHLALEAGHEQAVQRVDRGLVERVGVRVAIQRKLPQDRAFEILPGNFQLHLQRAFLVAAIDRQHAMRRNVAHGLGVFEVVAIFQALTFGEVFALGGDDLARFPDGAADGFADDRQLVDRLGQDVADAFEHALDGLQPLLGRDELGRRGVQVRQGLIAVPDAQGQGFEPLLASIRRLGALLGLVRQVEIFEPLGVVGRLDRVAKLVGQLALALNRLKNRVLAFGKVARRLTRS